MKTISRRAATLLAMLLSLALVAAACGDDQTTETASASDTEDGVSDSDAMDDDAMDGDEHGAEHSHGEAIDVPEGMAVPALALRTAPDSVKGVNLFVDVEDFRIAPENASTEAVDGEGHLHLYVDGERVMRFYNTALHLGDLSPGDHMIEVEVSANDHRAYAIDGTPIRASTTVTVPEPAAGHSHGGEDGATVAAPDPAPTVGISVSEDPKSGWNVAVDLAGLEINPEAEGSDPVDGEGHLHLYVDGERVTRLYGPNWHLAALTEGTHQVMVEVSANNHLPYGVDGDPIMAMATVEVSAERATAATEGDSHDDEHGEDAMEAMGDADQVIEASIAGGEVTVDDSRVDVALGSVVLLKVAADISDEIHLHGYDLVADVSPDTAAELTFTADTAGVFEVELESAGTFLFEVAVS